MTFETQIDRGARTRRYVVTITDDELVAAKFYPFDRKLLAECDTNDATIADQVLALELVTRRIEESKMAA